MEIEIGRAYSDTNGKNVFVNDDPSVFTGQPRKDSAKNNLKNYHEY